ncbi:MAG: zinc ribbon domain-containing protein, partial [Acidobacteria bacterium]|nr:zinc ribbon domain-containing protein [Acidobacteriota bacterium]
MYCYRCGNRLPDDSAFCNRCGVRLRTTTERVRGSRPIESDPTPYFSPRQTSGRSVERFRANHHIDDDEDTATDYS